MQRLAETCEAIAGTTKKLEKIAIVADYFNSRTAEEAGGFPLRPAVPYVSGNNPPSGRFAAVAGRARAF